MHSKGTCIFLLHLTLSFPSDHTSSFGRVSRTTLIGSLLCWLSFWSLVSFILRPCYLWLITLIGSLSSHMSLSYWGKFFWTTPLINSLLRYDLYCTQLHQNSITMYIWTSFQPVILCSIWFCLIHSNFNLVTLSFQNQCVFKFCIRDIKVQSWLKSKFLIYPSPGSLY